MIGCVEGDVSKISLLYPFPLALAIPPLVPDPKIRVRVLANARVREKLKERRKAY